MPGEGVVVAGRGPRIGWQFRRPAKGGACFLVGLPTALGSWQIVERFPLTEEGWADAWRLFASLDGAPVSQARARLAAREPAGRAGAALARDADAAPPGPGVGGCGGPSTAAPVVAELGRLASLLESGLVTREEFDRLKAQLLAGS